MQIVTISDLHGVLPDVLPDGDVLVIAGDICPARNHTLSYQRTWLDTRFRSWLTVQRAKYTTVCGCAGNHDFIFQEEPSTVASLNLPWHYFEDMGMDICGHKFWFSPHQPIFGNWAFNLTEEQLAEKWALIPKDTTVLVTHAPPAGILDLVPRDGGVHIGSTTLMTRVLELQKLQLHVFGHCHEGYGTRVLAPVTFVNASILDDRYEYANPPQVFTI